MRISSMKRLGLLVVFFLSAACASEEVFPLLTNELATPESLAIDSAARRLYVVNSNSLIKFQSEQGSFQVYDITDPLAPVLVGTAATSSLSGEIYLDAANSRAIVTNRWSADDGVDEDHLFLINIDEGSADFLSVTEVATELDPYALACCTANNELIFVTAEGKFQYTDLDDATLTVNTVDLLTELSSGGHIEDARLRDVVISGSQAFVSRIEGGIYVINLDELGVDGENPVDYFIGDVNAPRGMAIDGSTLYITDADTVSGDFQFRILVLDVSSLVALGDNDEAEYIDKNDDGLFSASIEVGDDPQNILIVGTQAFVSNNEDDNISVIDLNTNTVTDTIDVGETPLDFALDSPGAVDTTLYISNQEGNSLSILDLATMTVTATFTGL